MKDFFLKENVTFNDGNYANKILFAVCKKLKVSFKNMSVLTQPSVFNVLLSRKQIFLRLAL